MNPNTPVTRDHLHQVLQPIAVATGLPNSAYTSDAHFAFERNAVIGSTWAALGFTDTVPDRVTALPVDFMALPLLITRDRAGVLRVFHNVCSHRGMKLVHEPTDVQGIIRCPYHSWTYDPAGRLKGTPHIGGVNKHRCAGFNANEHGLKQLRSAEFMGMIFVNLDGQAPEFDTFIAPLRSRAERFFGAHGWDTMAPGASGSALTLTVQCNWKLAVENYCEAYHLPWIHPGLNSYSKLEDHYSFLDDATVSGQGSLVYRLSDVAGTRLPRFESWPEAVLRHAEYPALYPNVLFGFQADHAFAIILTPMAADTTREELRIFYVGDGSIADSFDASRTTTLEAWRSVFSEDIFAVEGMQHGRASPGYAGGVFSPVMDESTHHFHRWVANRVAVHVG